jgi:hypothetical protein
MHKQLAPSVIDFPRKARPFPESFRGRLYPFSNMDAKPRHSLKYHVDSMSGNRQRESIAQRLRGGWHSLSLVEHGLMCAWPVANCPAKTLSDKGLAVCQRDASRGNQARSPGSSLRAGILK